MHTRGSFSSNVSHYSSSVRGNKGPRVQSDRSRGGGNGNSLALVSVALQDHIMRNMCPSSTAPQLNPYRNVSTNDEALKPSKKIKAKSVIDTGLKSSHPKSKSSDTNKKTTEDEEKDHVIEEREELSRGINAKPSLAQKLGLVPGGFGWNEENGGRPVKLNELQWASVKKQAGERGDYSSACVICKETLGSQKQLIISCSHTFHQTCLEAFERFTGKKCCPMCRKEQYEKRIIHEASKAYKVQCAITIQSAWKGYVVRKWYRKLRQTNPPKDPKLRQKFFLGKFEELTDRMLTMYNSDVDAFLRELDFDLQNSRKIMSTFNFQETDFANGHIRLDEEFWDNVSAKAFARIDEDTSDCPICMFKLITNKTLAVCSCSHVFHSQCLQTFEELSLNEQTLCPVCRSVYYSIQK